MESKIFICHRHDEKQIAKVINSHIQDWGIRRNDIFLSSDFKGGGRIGMELDKELVTKLTESNLLIFIYTHPIHDWSYCMWECGVATTLDRATNIIVFECAEDTPSVFEKDIRVRVNKEEDIKKFTYQFHKDENFFRGQPPFNDKFSDEALEIKANRLFQDLTLVIPGGGYKEIPLLHLVKLVLNSENVNIVETKKSPDQAYDLLYKNLKILETSQYCPQQFGFQNIGENTEWSTVITRWKEKTKGQQYSDSWIHDIYDEIWRAIQNEPAQPGGKTIINVNGDREYIPLVCLLREYPDRNMLFNIYLYRINKG
ncbi:MAG: hypothetical protein PVG39_12800 [Desulfobacteraceae bacterium]|jgi:hypothetical protein